MTRPVLLLDAAGVLLREADPQVMADLAADLQVPFEDLHAWLEEVAYEPWWSGTWTPEDFWAALKRELHATPRDPQDVWMLRWQDACRPLSSVHDLEHWAKNADLWLLTDHRTRWVAGQLDRHLDRFDRVFISEELGFTKRDARFWMKVAAALEGRQPVAYLDDRPANLERAAQWIPQLSCHRADPAGRWTAWAGRFCAQGG